MFLISNTCMGAHKTVSVEVYERPQACFLCAGKDIQVNSDLRRTYIICLNSEVRIGFRKKYSQKNVNTISVHVTQLAKQCL